MEEYKILSVTECAGSKFNSSWRGRMQEITTDKGVFIDNLPGVTYGGFLGHNWKNEVGNTVRASIVISANNKWLKYECQTQR